MPQTLPSKRVPEYPATFAGAGSSKVMPLPPVRIRFTVAATEGVAANGVTIVITPCGGLVADVPPWPTAAHPNVRFPCEVVVHCDPAHVPSGVVTRSGTGKALAWYTVLAARAVIRPAGVLRLLVARSGGAAALATLASASEATMTMSLCMELLLPSRPAGGC